jgi:hypothetical protein
MFDDGSCYCTHLGVIAGNRGGFTDWHCPAWKETASRCVLTPGRSLDCFALPVPFYTGDHPGFMSDCRLCTADKAKAVFIEAAVSQLMQSIDHVVMTTCKRSINPGPLQYR